MSRFHTIRKAPTEARGYGQQHRRARAYLAQRHSPTDPCTRCHKPLGPMGPWLHLDHNEARTAYLGFAHSTCNKRAGAKEGNRRQRIAAGGPNRRGQRRRAW